MSKDAPEAKLVWIDWLKVVSAFAVVVIHVTTPYFVKYDDIGRADWWLANVLNSSSRFAVPMFVMVSGALLLGKEIGTVDFYKKRAVRLLPPFLFWTGVYMVFVGIFSDNFLYSVAYSIKNGLIRAGSVYYHLWYLSMYMCLMAFFPFLNNYILGVRPQARDFMALLAVAAPFYILSQISAVLSELFKFSMNWFSMFAWYIVYFVLGYFVSRYKEFGVLRSSALILPAVISMLCGVFLNYVVFSNFQNVKDQVVLVNNGIFLLAITVCLFAFFKKNEAALRESKTVSRIAEASFGIYLIHPIYIYFLRKYVPGYYEFGFVCMPASIAAVFAMSFATITLLRRYKWFRAVC